MPPRFFSSESEWEACRPLITELRQIQGLTLKQIQMHIVNHCGLKATFVVAPKICPHLNLTFY
jgi:hypothetical protein